LKIYRTDLGLLIMSALTINDVAGWIVFALILGTVTEAGMSLQHMVFVLVATIGFAAFCLTLGSKLFNRTLGFFEKARVPEPAGSLTLVCFVGLLGGAFTTAIGIHALFGFFIAGIMAGESPRLSERTRSIFDQMVQAILVPLFFTAIGLKLDFLGNFDPFLVVFMLVIGMTGRYVAAFVGARMVGQSSLHSRLIADAHIPGGEMQIIIGMLALEYGVISPPVYVAIVFGAIITSVVSGPLMSRLLHRIEKIDWLAFLPVDHILPDLHAATRDEAIARLCAKAATSDPSLSEASLLQTVQEREQAMSTALGEGLAAPHARIKNLARPLVLFARLSDGVDWNSPDGLPVRLVWLLVTPEHHADIQIQILQGISRSLQLPEIRTNLLLARSTPELLEIFRKGQKSGETRKKKKQSKG
jgi:mannitol/fructose-specific phosphotransferase system IIA component (Ntr-type)